MLILFYFVLLFCFLSYWRLDPLKSCFFLICSLIFLLPLLGLSSTLWFSFFVCIIFLRGVFVILVYFSGLSSYNFIKLKGVLFFFFSCFVLYTQISITHFNYLNFFYFNFNLFLLIWLLLVLLVYLLYLSYIINFGAGLRKIYDYFIF